MWKRTAVGALMAIVLGAILTFGAGAIAETISWSNPTTDNTGAALTTTQQSSLTNYLRYRVPPTTGAWTYFGETSGGKTSWIGTLPPAAGVEAEYSVSASLRGGDGVERDSAYSTAVRYTVPFPPGPTPGSPAGMTITR